MSKNAFSLVRVNSEFSRSKLGVSCVPSVASDQRSSESGQSLSLLRPHRTGGLSPCVSACSGPIAQGDCPRVFWGTVPVCL